MGCCSLRTCSCVRHLALQQTCGLPAPHLPHSPPYRPHPGPVQASSSPLGSSPLGSFESEWLAFMTSSISHGRSKQRRRAQRGGMGGPGAELGTVGHDRWHVSTGCAPAVMALAAVLPASGRYGGPVCVPTLLPRLPTRCCSPARGPRHLPPEACAPAAAVLQAPALRPVGRRLRPQRPGGEAGRPAAALRICTSTCCVLAA